MNYEQRMRYKADFNQNFVKYRKLHNVLDQHSKRFAHLESQLKNHQRGSKEFKVSSGQLRVEVGRCYLTLLCFRM